MSLSTAPPGEPDGPPLSDPEWERLTALEVQLDLEEVDDRPLPGARAVSALWGVAAWLRWLLDPKAEGLPMPSLLGRRRPRRPVARGAGRPPSA